MAKQNDADAIPQGTVVCLADGLAVVGDGPDSDDQYRIVRLFTDHSGPGFADEACLTEIVGRISAYGSFDSDFAAAVTSPGRSASVK
ncbi:hypothetical protein [Salinisphaera sp. T31B1]|uniref:hypothetical protein n=1 Tax=Salinisphaera sp. T31B1 TaxID=727963 RepID=UPI0033407984